MAGEVYDENGNLVAGPPVAPLGPLSVADNFGIIPGSGVPFGGPKSGKAPGRPILPQSVKEVTDHLTNPSDWIGGTGKPPAATPVEQFPEPLDSPGGGGDDSRRNNESLADADEMALRARLRGAGGMPAPYYEPEGSSMAGIGGPKKYDEAFVKAPGRREAAMTELGQVQTDRSKELAALYDRQAMQDQKSAEAMAIKQQQDQEEMAHQKEQLSKASKFYSRDLADNGKFWTNPGNIIAAISYSLLPIFSNDPTVGAKLINQAVQQDMENRQKAAEHTLGHMRSNLDGYRKIAGDRQAGDLLARAEAHRMAAQEIQRVGAKFAGPEAQAAMKVQIEDQNTRAATAEMEFWNRYVHTAPQRTVQGMTDARYQGEGGWAPLGKEPKNASAARGNLPKGGGATQVTMKPMDPTVRAIAKVSGIEGVDRYITKGGKVDPKTVDALIESEFIAEAHARHPGDPQAPIKMYIEEEKKLEPFIMKTRETSRQRAMVSDVLSKMDLIERSELAHNRSPEDFITWAETAWPNSWVLEYRKFTAKDPRFAANPAEASAAYRRERIDAFKSQLYGYLNEHNHELFGGAQTATGPGGGEIMRGKLEVGDKSSWSGIKTHLSGRSRQLQAEQTDTLAGLSPMARMIVRKRTNNNMDQSKLPHAAVQGPPAKSPTPRLPVYGPPNDK